MFTRRHATSGESKTGRRRIVASLICLQRRQFTSTSRRRVNCSAVDVRRRRLRNSRHRRTRRDTMATTMSIMSIDRVRTATHVSARRIYAHFFISPATGLRSVPPDDPLPAFSNCLERDVYEILSRYNIRGDRYKLVQAISQVID